MTEDKSDYTVPDELGMKIKPRPGWRWHLFGRDVVNGEVYSLMSVGVIPERVATPWRRRLTEILMGSEWVWEE